MIILFLLAVSPDAGSALTPDSIRDVVHEHRPEIRRCADAAVARKKTLAGKVVMHFVISSKGAVSSASVKESTVGDSKLEACVAAAIKGWRFSPPKHDSVEINFPFHFGEQKNPPKVKLAPGEPEIVE